jgi:hypothetical protein
MVSDQSVAVSLGHFGLRHLADLQVPTQVVATLAGHVRPPVAIDADDEIDAALVGVYDMEVEWNARIATGVQYVVQLLRERAINRA